MVKRVKYLPNGGTITTTNMTEEEFRKLNPNAITINSEEDAKKLAESLGVDFDKVKKNLSNDKDAQEVGKN